jgi:NADPH-dependent ferric siderophore reductase
VSFGASGKHPPCQLASSKGCSQSESPKSYAVDISMISRLAPGLRRVRASLPKLFDRVYPNALYDETPKMPLEKSEAAHWNLPAVEEDKAA